MNNPLATLTDQFLKERTYLKNVTPATLVWYRVAFKSYRASFPNNTAPVPTKAALLEFVVRQRDHGLRSVTVNTYIGAMNAFCVWLHAEGHVTEHIKLAKLRVERRMLSILDDTQMRIHPRSLSARQSAHSDADAPAVNSLSHRPTVTSSGTSFPCAGAKDATS